MAPHFPKTPAGPVDLDRRNRWISVIILKDCESLSRTFHWHSDITPNIICTSLLVQFSGLDTLILSIVCTLTKMLMIKILRYDSR